MSDTKELFIVTFWLGNKIECTEMTTEQIGELVANGEYNAIGIRSSRKFMHPVMIRRDPTRVPQIDDPVPLPYSNVRWNL